MRLNFSYASRSNLFIYELYPLCIFLLDFWYFFLLNPKSSSRTRDITPLSVRRCRYFLPVCQLLLTLFVEMFPHQKGSFVTFVYSRIDYLFLFPLDFKSENSQQPGQSGIRMVSIFTFGTLICLFIPMYAVRHGSNFIFFQMINQLSHTIKKKNSGLFILFHRSDSCTDLI